MLFRTLAILLYVFASIFFSSFITIFVVIIICLSLDFWTVKNITGRLLVGLRWWNHVDEDGKSNWIYENRKVIDTLNFYSHRVISNFHLFIKKNNGPQGASNYVESTTEATIFWSSIIICDVIWSVFLMISLLTFSFKWMTIIMVAIMLNLSNTYGFLKCRYGSEQNMQNMATTFFGKQMFKSVNLLFNYI